LFSQLTYAPLLEWNHLFSILFSFNKISDNDLASPWLRDGEKGYWYSRSAWALLAIAKYRNIITGNDKVNVWLPGYFCNESTNPLRNYNAELSFYPILPNGSPDFAACNNMLNNSSPDLFVLVHYFGDLIDSRASFNFAKNNDAWLVEDAAHIALPYNGIGENGDFVFYSPHKLLPIPDGALLVVRPDGPGKIKKANFKNYGFQNLEKEFMLTSKSSLTPYIWLIKRLLQKFGIRSKSYITTSFYENDRTNETFIRPKMSLLAKKLLAIMINNLDEEIKKRRNILIGWIKYLSISGLIKDKMSQIIEMKTPYLAVMHFNKSKDANKAYASLLNAKIPVSTWPDLPPEVLIDDQKQKVAIRLRSCRIFLPVHRSITEKSIKSGTGKINFQAN
jgi:dTDP-4-amino-4,6-dideoxygalactose transaminase